MLISYSYHRDAFVTRDLCLNKTRHLFTFHYQEGIFVGKVVSWGWVSQVEEAWQLGMRMAWSVLRARIGFMGGRI